MFALVNRAAQRLGRMARGKPKQYSAQEIKRRTKLLELARKRRWPIKPDLVPA